MLIPLPIQEDQPPGRTWSCQICKARVRQGEIHRSDLPWPHATLEAMGEFPEERSH